MQSGILRLAQAEDLRYVRRSDLAGDSVSQQEFEHMLRLVNGFWVYNGDPDPAVPHAELTSGMCSNGFFDTMRLLKYTAVCGLLAGDMAADYREIYPNPDWVIGSDHAAATVSYEVAKALGAKHAFTEKREEGGQKFQDWKRETIGPDELVLQAEELVSTLLTLQLVHDGIITGNANPVQFVPVSICLVHRSPEGQFNGRPIAHRYHYDIDAWWPADCPHCAVGSERVKPKANWAKLTQAA